MAPGAPVAQSASPAVSTEGCRRVTYAAPLPLQPMPFTTTPVATGVCPGVRPGAPLRLVMPFEQVCDQDRQPVRDFPLVATRHVRQVFREVGPVDLGHDLLAGHGQGLAQGSVAPVGQVGLQGPGLLGCEPAGDDGRDLGSHLVISSRGRPRPGPAARPCA